jgi:hypothetical protein
MIFYGLMPKSILARNTPQSLVFVKLNADAGGAARKNAPMVEGLSMQ